MAEFDHLVFACTDLEQGVAQIQELTGVTAAPGGPHPGGGTYNALLSLGERVYLEIIAPDPNQDAPPAPRPFGLDDLSPGQGRLANFAIHPTPPETIHDVAGRLTSHGHSPGPISAMSRIKPDGEVLNWELAGIPTGTSGLIPFIIEWGETTHPATVTPTGATLVSMSGTSTQPAAMRQLHADLGLEISVSESAGPEEISAVLECPNGRVELH